MRHFVHSANQQHNLGRERWADLGRWRVSSKLLEKRGPVLLHVLSEYNDRRVLAKKKGRHQEDILCTRKVRDSSVAAKIPHPERARAVRARVPILLFIPKKVAYQRSK